MTNVALTEFQFQSIARAENLTRLRLRPTSDMARSRWWDCGVRWLRSSRLGQAQKCLELEARWGPKTPWTTGAGDEITTQRLRGPAQSRRARERVHRPDVPQRLRAAVAAHRWRRVVSAWPPRPAFCFDGWGAPKTETFVADIERFVADQGVEIVSFGKPQRKDEVTQ